MAIEYSTSAQQFYASKSTGPIVQAFTAAFLCIGVGVGSQIPLTTGEDILGFLFVMGISLIPNVLSFFGRKTAVVDRVDRTLEIYFEIRKTNLRFFTRKLTVTTNTRVRAEKITRSTSKGSYLAYVVIVEDATTATFRELFDLGSAQEAMELSSRIGQFLDIKDATPSDFQTTPHPGLPTFNPQSLPGMLVVACVFLFILAIGFPFNVFKKPSPPEGVATYRKENMTCWDKTVCCKEGVSQTCETIPTCILD